MELRTNQKLVNNLMALPVRARSNIRRMIQTELVPALEARANALAESMGPVSSPFAFGTVMTGPVLQLSRKYYFWLIRNNPGLTDGEHWIRQFVVESGFQFTAKDRIKEIQVTGRNPNPESRYLYGPWAVEGHINTGWPERGEMIRKDLQAFMRVELARMWRDAVNEALKGNG